MSQGVEMLAEVEGILSAVATLVAGVGTSTKGRHGWFLISPTTPKITPKVSVLGFPTIFITYPLVLL